VGIVGILWNSSEPAIVVRHVLRQEGITVFHVADTAQAQLFHKTILQGLVHALNATFRLW
jgi:hypothetical protein